VVPSLLRPIVLKYYHDAVSSAHLGGWKTYHKIAANFWWPHMRREIFFCVRKCDLCQCAKRAQNQRVGFHSATTASEPMQRLFINGNGTFHQVLKDVMKIQL